MGTESLEEWVEVEAADNRPLAKIAERLNQELPEGMRATSVIQPKTKLTLTASHYRISPEPGEGGAGSGPGAGPPGLLPGRPGGALPPGTPRARSRSSTSASRSGR